MQSAREACNSLPSRMSRDTVRFSLYRIAPCRKYAFRPSAVNSLPSTTPVAASSMRSICSLRSESGIGIEPISESCLTACNQFSMMDSLLALITCGCAVPKCVLLVDDSPVIRSALRTMAESAGIAVCGEAGDGAQAIEKAEQLKPDLIVLDLSMP